MYNKVWLGWGERSSTKENSFAFDHKYQWIFPNPSSPCEENNPKWSNGNSKNLAQNSFFFREIFVQRLDRIGIRRDFFGLFHLLSMTFDLLILWRLGLQSRAILTTIFSPDKSSKIHRDLFPGIKFLFKFCIFSFSEYLKKINILQLSFQLTTLQEQNSDYYANVSVRSKANKTENHACL